MDELVKHCLRELAFEGDLGCSVQRLRDFVNEYHSSRISSDHQDVDDVYFDFVWSIVIQQPPVSVGCIPAQFSGIYFPLQASTGKNGDPQESKGLEVIPDARTRTLTSIREQFGDKVHVAVDPATCFFALTGSHAKPSKLTAMVYSVLQLVGSSREEGISVLDIGRTSKYDQKHVFYLVKQLLELGLVVKLRRGGSSLNFCVHKFFYDNSPLWQEVRKEEERGHIEEESSNEWTGTSQEAPTFSQIELRHLTSLGILRSRLVKLLKASPKLTCPYENIAVRIGFQPQSRTERRFFITRVKELVQEGTIEKVTFVNKTHSKEVAKTLCLRLVTEENRTKDNDVEKEDVDEEDDEELLINRGESLSNLLKANLTVQRQILDFVQESGITGVTCNEISDALAGFDRRTIELLLGRMETYPQPKHLASFGIRSVQETYGREKRRRYFTLSHYMSLMDKEGIAQAPSASGTTDHHESEDFMNVSPSQFYINVDECNTYVDQFKSLFNGTSTSVRKGGERKTNTKKYVNPILADGTRKRGRPRKDASNPKKAKKAKNDSGSGMEGDGEVLDENPKRGRKRKAAVLESDEANDVTQTLSVAKAGGDAVAQTNSESESPMQPPAKRSKRDSSGTVALEVAESANAPPKKKRGRPPKSRPSVVIPQEEDSVAVKLPSNDAGILMNDANDPPLLCSPSATVQCQTTQIVEGTFGNDDQSVSSSIVPHNAGDVVASVMPPSESESRRHSAERLKSLTFDEHVSSQAASVSLPVGLYAGEKCGDHADLEHAMDNVPDGMERSNNALGSVTSSDVRLGRKQNFSNNRRRKEFLRIIEENGGVVNTSLNSFCDDHVRIVGEMSKAGDATSCPVGTRCDRRTLNATLDSMELTGMVRLVRVSLPSTSGAERLAKVACLPSFPEDQLQTFISKLSTLASDRHNLHQPTTVIDNLSTDDSPQGNAMRWAREYLGKNWSHSRWFRNDEAFDQLMTYPEEVLREALLLERQTVSQMYGYIPGKLERARAVHLQVAKLFGAANSQCAHLVSSEHQIVKWEYFMQELPLCVYCSICPISTLHDGLLDLCGTSGGGMTLVKDVPMDIRPVLPSGHKIESHFLRLLQILASLKVAIPLRVADPGSGFVEIQTSNGKRISFAALPEDWASLVPSIAPQYWHFAAIAPVFIVALSRTNPVFLKDSPLTTYDLCVDFWNTLKSASLDLSWGQSVVTPSNQSITGPCTYPNRISKDLRRESCWQTSYDFSWFQLEYLRRQLNQATSDTPLDDPQWPTLLQRLSDNVHAPFEAIQRYCTDTKAACVKETPPIRTPKAHKGEKSRTAENRKLIKEKAAEARRRSESLWEDLVQRTCTEPLTDIQTKRINRLRNPFCQDASANKEITFEEKIRDILKVTKSSAKVKKLFRSTTSRGNTEYMRSQSSAHIRHSAPSELSDIEKSIELLIEQQRTAFAGHASAEPLTAEQKGGKAKRKRKKADGGDIEAHVEDKSQKTRTRKSRFKWNKSFDELLKDAYVIVKSRCKTHHRMEWTALDELFPFIFRNSARQRLVHLRETPGIDTYLRRLEECWYDLWMKNRCSAELPDNEVITPTNFNIKTHVAYLRKHVDKNAIRVGILMDEENEKFALPSSIDMLATSWDVDERKETQGNWDFLWNNVTEEGREKQALEEAMTADLDETFTVTHSGDLIAVAESAMKMVIGTTSECYDPQAAASLLHGVGDDAVEKATENLLSQNVLSKLVRDVSKAAPGRTMKISEVNQNALVGQFSPEIFGDAVQFEEAYLSAQPSGHNDTPWRDWPLLSTDGDTAAILQLFSDDLVLVKFDTSNARRARNAVDMNSKKANDDDIEIAFQIQVRSVGKASNGTAVEFVYDGETPVMDGVGHGQVDSGSPACCSLTSGGIIDCAECLEESASAVLQSCLEEEHKIATAVLQILFDNGPSGMQKGALMGIMEQKWPSNCILPVLQKLFQCRIPLVFPLGYSDCTFVSARHVSPWTVSLQPTGSEEDALDFQVTKAFPKRWMNITGKQIPEVWTAALRNLIAIVHTRPGICQAELRWRLGTVLDRLEVIELMKYLVESGFLVPHVFGSEKLPSLEFASCWEEQRICWTANHTMHWYQVA